MSVSEQMQAHLDTGLTTLCRAWAITRADGTIYGFTDHDCTLSFEGVTFRADTGLTALALQQSTGLSVDNTEALGALSDVSLREEDILAGRFDGASVQAWLVNWSDVAQREVVFRGTIGELTRIDGAFRAEVRGLADQLNRPFGRVIQKTCAAVLGDAQCRFDRDQPGYRFDGEVIQTDGRAAFIINPENTFAEDWFRHGACEVLDGAAKGLSGVIKRDTSQPTQGRRIELWEPLRAAIAPGDRVRLTAGCDKAFKTCRLKFNNLLNFQGFPDVPEDDWVVTAAPSAMTRNGGSRR
ncbi:DUF2163 domain-containing protein [Primorskyibacter sp. S187A]|uniref:DUF2163 domain-containing protein n=1 Tax=Primorskyibacter sp. S187A TaxID=3415130 RepID=UPI003C7AE323